MRDDLTNNRFLKDAIASTIRHDDAMREINKYDSAVKEAHQWEEMKKAAGIYPDYRTSAMDKKNLASNLGLAYPVFEEYRRTAEIRKGLDISDYMNSAMDKKDLALTAHSSGIAGYVIDEMARQECRPIFPVISPVPDFDYEIFRPTPDPMHKVNKLLEKSESKQTEIANHLKEIASQGLETAGQNNKMLWWTKVSAIAAIVAILITYFSSQTGKSSSASNTSPLTAVKASPVIQAIPAHAPTKK